MSWLEDHEVTINMAVFKRYRFYQLFDPNGPRTYGYNVHRSTSVAFFAIVLAVNVFSALSFFADAEDAVVDTVDSLLAMFIYCVNVITFLKIAVFLRRADAVWDLFDSTRIDFLTSARCRANVATLHGSRDRSTRLTDHFQNLTSGVFSLWCAVPLAYNAFAPPDGPGRRYQNVFNLRYPVTAAVFNGYYCVFYMMEVTMGLFILYNSILIDVFLISVCSATTAQYEVLGAAFAGIGHDGDESTGRANDECKINSLRAYEDFKLILNDQILVYKKLKLFYSVIWIIVVTLIFINSITLIILSYSFVVILTSAEPFAIYTLVKLPVTYLCFALQIFLYCYLFGELNDKKESVSFGMYSCDWMKMDIKFKKLLLLAMRMNNANQLMIKTSPTKIVNVQLFANVMSTTYNIVSVMLNRTSKSAIEAGS